jgi:hypothetical protein
LNQAVVTKTRYKPVQKSSSILEKVKSLEDQMLGRFYLIFYIAKGEQAITAQSDKITQIIMDKPIQAKKKIPKNKKFVIVDK